MALQIPQYKNPFDPANPLQNSYAWTAGLGLDLAAGQGRLVLNVHPSESAWQAPPIDQVSISLGEVLVKEERDEQGEITKPEVRVKTLAELMADPEFAQAYAVIGSKLYIEAAKHPKFAGATQV